MYTYNKLVQQQMESIWGSKLWYKQFKVLIWKKYAQIFYIRIYLFIII